MRRLARPLLTNPVGFIAVDALIAPMIRLGSIPSDDTICEDGSTKIASSGRPSTSTLATPSTVSKSRRMKVAMSQISASENPGAETA